eukprot:7387019-Prymnesium_polylepis.1
MSLGDTVHSSQRPAGVLLHPLAQGPLATRKHLRGGDRGHPIRHPHALPQHAKELRTPHPLSRRPLLHRLHTRDNTLPNTQQGGGE